MKRFLSYVRGWRGIALITYMWLVLMAWVIVYVDVFSVEMKKRFYIVSIAETLLLILLYVCPKLLRCAECLSIKPNSEVLTQEHRRKFFLKSWLASFAVLFIMYVIFYPGGFNGDAISQFSQASGNNYNDWHPVINTFFSFKLPLFLTGNWKGAPVLFQVIIFSLSLAYMSSVLMEYTNRRYAKYFLIYILLNPATTTIFLVTLKDSSFAIAMMLLMTFAVRIFFTGGKWLRSFLHSVIFVTVLAAGSLFRHNAVLFTLPLFFAVSLCVKKRHALTIFVSTLVLVYLVRYPLYDNLNVVRPGKRQIETSGVMISIIGNAVKESPERLDKDILEFAYSLASKDVWHEKYNIINGFISIKYAAHERSRNEVEKQKLENSIYIDAIEEAGWKKIADMTFRCFKQAPLSSLRGALGVTSTVYGIAGPPLGRIVPQIAPNNLGLSDNKSFNLSFVKKLLDSVVSFFGADNYKSETGGTSFRFSSYEGDNGNFTLQSLIILWNYAVMVLFRHVFWCIGLLNLVVIIFILAKLNFGKASDWKKLCIALPMLLHNFGTMLLLQANDFRYFYCSYLVLPLVLAVILRDNSEVKL